MAPPASRLYDLASSVLAAVEAFYALAGEPLPARRYVSPGLPAWDCDEGQVTAQVLRTFGIAGSIAQETVAPLDATFRRGAELAVEVVRCTPTLGDDGNPPTAAALEASAVTLLRDAQMMTNAVLDAQASGLLPGCGGVAIMGWSSVGPDGALLGGTLVLRLDTSGG